MLEDRPTSRGAFLKKLGALVGAGMGLSLVGARVAWAQGSYCCYDPGCSSSLHCGPGQSQYQCHDACNKTTCCACGTWQRPCQYELPCGCG